RIKADGSILDPVAIRLRDAPQPQLTETTVADQFRISWDGTAHLVVWIEQSASGPRAVAPVYGARVNASGVALDNNAFLIATGAGIDVSHSNSPPAVTWDGKNHLVVFPGTRGLNAV